MHRAIMSLLWPPNQLPSVKVIRNSAWWRFTLVTAISGDLLSTSTSFAKPPKQKMTTTTTMMPTAASSIADPPRLPTEVKVKTTRVRATEVKVKGT